jgi:hypothetical protein
MTFGDFDGDGNADVFAVEFLGPFGSEGTYHATYRWMHWSGGTGNFRILAEGAPYPDGFGDFDGNGTTDVFTATPFGNVYQWMLAGRGGQSS